MLCNGRVYGCVGRQLGMFVDGWVRMSVYPSSTRGTGRENDNVIAVEGGRLGVGGGCQWIHDWLQDFYSQLSVKHEAEDLHGCGVGIWIGS